MNVNKSLEKKNNIKEPIYHVATDVYKEARIIRNKYTKLASLEINTQSKWSLFAGNSPETINLDTPIATGKDHGIYPLYVSTSERSYFKLTTDHGEAILSETQLPMAGGYNFRDLGGMQSSNGKHIKWGKIFRTDDLYNLTPEDLQYLSSIPINYVIDFRYKDECSSAPDRFPNGLKKCYSLSIKPGNLLSLRKQEGVTKEDIIEKMMDLYRIMVSTPDCIAIFKEFFKIMERGENPLIFHCSAGKDRTGVAASLLLFSLDIPYKTIMEDYMSSNEYLDDKYLPLFEENPINKYLYTVRPEFLESAISEINKKYGCVQSYLQDVLDVKIDKMKEIYLF